MSFGTFFEEFLREMPWSVTILFLRQPVHRFHGLLVSRREDTFPKVGGCSFGLTHPTLPQPHAEQFLADWDRRGHSLDIR